jgi:transketolase C-terminal domain/subunit
MIKMYKTIIPCSFVWKECRLRAYENRVLRKIFAAKREVVMEGSRKLLNEEPDNLYSSPIITKVMKLKWVREAENVTCMGEGQILVRKLMAKDHLENLGISWKIIIDKILEKQRGKL